jgi:hypothetical protein
MIPQAAATAVTAMTQVHAATRRILIHPVSAAVVDNEPPGWLISPNRAQGEASRKLVKLRRPRATTGSPERRDGDRAGARHSLCGQITATRRLTQRKKSLLRH